MSELATNIGWTVMTAGGVCLTGALVWLAAELVWKAWRSWRGFFNIVEAFQALEEKRRAAKEPQP